jgi:magnesium transporter
MPRRVEQKDSRSRWIGKAERRQPATRAENMRTSRESCEASADEADPERRGSPRAPLSISARKKRTRTITAFNDAGIRCDERQGLSLDILAPPTDESVTWVDVGGVHKMEILESFGKQFQLHPLLLEDIPNTDQRPKLDDYETYVFVVMKMLSLYDRQDVLIEQVSLVLGRNFVLSFLENGTDVFQSVRERLRASKGRLRHARAGYLLDAHVDAIVDQYFAVL